MNPDIIHQEAYIQKSERFIDCSYRISRRAMQLILILGSLVKEQDLVSDQPKKIRITLASMVALVDPTGKNGQLYREFREAAMELYKKEVTIRYPDGGEENFRWISAVGANKEPGILEVEISSYFLPFLHQLKTRYSAVTRLSVKIAVRLGDFPTMRIYEKLKRHLPDGEFVWSIEDIRSFLWLEEKQYPRFSNLNQRILTPAFDKINRIADREIQVSKQEVYDGNKVVAIRCSILPPEKSQMSTEFLLPPTRSQEVVEKLLGLQFSHGRIARIFANPLYTDEYILEKIVCYEEQSGHVESPVKFLYAALKNDFKPRAATPSKPVQEPLFNEADIDPDPKPATDFQYIRPDPSTQYEPEELDRLFKEFIETSANSVIYRLSEAGKRRDHIAVRSQFINWLSTKK